MVKRDQHSSSQQFHLDERVDTSAGERRTEVSAPPRRVPSLYPTSPPTSIGPEAVAAQHDRPIAHSLRPKTTPITLEVLQEQRTSIAVAEETMTEQTLYDLFEVHPSISEEELRRAYKRMWACFHPDHFSGYGLFSRAQQEALLAKLQAAFELLMDPIKRSEYDLKTFPQGLPSPREKSQESPSRLMPTFLPLISPQEAKTLWRDLGSTSIGASMKSLRERMNLPLSAVHERSKISLSMLELIEADDFQNLPAEVYLRGFIKELSQLYSLQKQIDIESYLNAYRAHKSR